MENFNSKTLETFAYSDMQLHGGSKPLEVTFAEHKEFLRAFVAEGLKDCKITFEKTATDLFIEEVWKKICEKHKLMKSMGHQVRQVICEERIQALPLSSEIVAANERFRAGAAPCL